MSKATKKETSDSEKTSKAKSKEKKPKEQVNQIQVFIQFCKDSWTEFKKIQWPTRKQAFNESVIVLITVVFIVTLVNFYDFISHYLLNFIFQK
jgi:preprotein translocase SecE subunit